MWSKTNARFMYVLGYMLCSGVQRVLDARGQREFWMPTSQEIFSCQFISKNF